MAGWLRVELDFCDLPILGQFDAVELHHPGSLTIVKQLQPA